MKLNFTDVAVRSLSLESAARRQNKERVKNGKEALPLDQVKQVTISDTKEPRLLLVIGQRKKTWTVVYYPDGKRNTAKLGEFPSMGVAKARDKCRNFDPQAILDAESFNAVKDEFLKREVTGKEVTDRRGLTRVGLRSAGEYERHLRYAGEIIGSKNMMELRREDIARVSDKITDERGAGVAGQVLGSLQTMFLWYEGRKSGFHSPIVRAMMKRRAKSVPRSRILTDAEIKALMNYQDGPFADLCRTLLLTGQRLSKVVHMRWEEVSLDGTWNMPVEANEKGCAGALLLPKAALDIIAQQPRIDASPYIFSGRGGTWMSGLSKRMLKLQEALGNPGWTLHDLRRTARSLLARAGVRPDHAERVLGHVIEGVEGTYDRHDYKAEKSDALASLSTLIGRIVTPPQGNVVPLASHSTAP